MVNDWLALGCIGGRDLHSGIAWCRRCAATDAFLWSTSKYMHLSAAPDITVVLPALLQSSCPCQGFTVPVRVSPSLSECQINMPKLVLLQCITLTVVLYIVTFLVAYICSAAAFICHCSAASTASQSAAALQYENGLTLTTCCTEFHALACRPQGGICRCTSPTSSKA